MNELVKYNNDMNKIRFTGLTKAHMDLLMAICAKVKSRGTDEVILKTQELKELVHFERGGKRDFFEELREMTMQLQKLNGSIVDRTPDHRKFINFVLFTVFEYDDKEGWLKVQVNKRFAHLLNEFDQYTSFELDEFVKLKSKYGKNLYRFLKKWRGTGKYEFRDFEELKAILDAPASYTNKYMIERCINVAVEDIKASDNSFKDFKCTLDYWCKRGRPLKSITFTWQPERKEFVDWNADQVEGQISFANNKEFDNIVDDCKTKPANKFHNFEQSDYSKRWHDLNEKDALKGLTPEEKEEFIRLGREARGLVNKEV